MKESKLIALKEAILKSGSFHNELEECYLEMLAEFDFKHATLLFKLLEIAQARFQMKDDSRVEEIFKVFDLIRFPVKKVIE